MIKKLLSIILLALPIFILGQETLYFNYSFQGEYNPINDDYSNNMRVDSISNVSFYINQEQTKIVVTNTKDTLFNYNIINIENDEGMVIFNTTTFFNEAVFMLEENRNGITMLYEWVEETEQIKMHYKYKYFWSNR